MKFVAANLGIQRCVLDLKWACLGAVTNPFDKGNDEHKYIFSHVPKAAGLSIFHSLFPSAKPPGHLSLTLYKYGDREKFRRYFKFSFVRNPWDRTYSAYCYLKGGGRSAADKVWAEENLVQFRDFESFILSLQRRVLANKVKMWPHFRPQMHYIADRKNNILADYVGRVERIHQDFEIVRQKLKIECALRHMNKSNKPFSYGEIYTEKMRTIVGDMYQEDIHFLDYDFES